MYFLGVSTAHDSSVCLYKNGSIEKFYKEERLSRKKRDRNPIRAIEKTLDGIKEIECFAFCPPVDNDYPQYLEIVEKYSKINNGINLFDKHHLQHASQAFYNSGFNEACTIVIDRNGSKLYDTAFESESIFYCSYPDNLKEIYKNYWMYDSYSAKHIQDKNKENPDCEHESRSLLGITKMYESATMLIMQGVLENGKTMGLSAYGEKNKNFPNLFVENTNIANDYYFSHENIFGDFECVFRDLNNIRTKEINKENYKIYADYAWQVQDQTQKAVSFLVEKAIKKTNLKNICITGGYGLNVVANAYLIEKYPEINFYFEPIADDTGNSIGGAMLAYRIFTQDKTIYRPNNTFFHGKEYSVKEYLKEKINYEDIANFLTNKKSVGLYYSLAEAGPRALGHRSIIFDARNNDSKDLINRVKKREWYRPFAAVMLKEDAEEMFEINKKYDYSHMTINCKAKEKAKKMVPGVIHVDGTCRIQIVYDENEPIFKLLKSFKEKTGLGILLNTSFNLAGMPLVETPEEAFETFNESLLDVLWFPEKEGGIIKC